MRDLGYSRVVPFLETTSDIIYEKWNNFLRDLDHVKNRSWLAAELVQFLEISNNIYSAQLRM